MGGGLERKVPLMLRWPRSGPRSIHQDKANLLHHTLRGPATPGTSDPMEAAGGQKVGLSLQKQPPSEDQAMQLDHTDTPAEQDYATVHVALELSKKKWLLGMMLPGSQKISRYTIAGGDVARLTGQFAEGPSQGRAA